MKSEFNVLKNNILKDWENNLNKNENIDNNKFLETINKFNKFFIIEDDCLLDIYNLLIEDNKIISTNIIENLLEKFFKDYYWNEREFSEEEKIYIIENLKIIINKFDKEMINKNDLIDFISDNNLPLKNETILFISNLEEVINIQTIENIIENLEELILFKNELNLSYKENKTVKKIDVEYLTDKINIEFNIIFNKLTNDDKNRLKEIYNNILNYLNYSKIKINKNKILKHKHNELKTKFEKEKNLNELKIRDNLFIINKIENDMKNMNDENKKLRKEIDKKIINNNNIKEVENDYNLELEIKKLKKEIKIYKKEIIQKNNEITEKISEKKEFEEMYIFYKNEKNNLDKLIKNKEKNELKNSNIYENKIKNNENKYKMIEDEYKKEIYMLNCKVNDLENNNLNLEKQIKDFKEIKNSDEFKNFLRDTNSFNKSLFKNNFSDFEFESKNNSINKDKKNNLIISQDKNNLKIIELENIINNLKEINKKNIEKINELEKKLKIKELENNNNELIVNRNTMSFKQKRLSDSNLKLSKLNSNNSSENEKINNSLDNEINLFMSQDKLNIKIKDLENINKEFKLKDNINNEKIIELEDKLNKKELEFKNLEKIKDENKILKEKNTKISEIISSKLNISTLEKDEIIKEFKKLKKEIKFLNKDKENLLLEIDCLKKIISYYENKSPNMNESKTPKSIVNTDNNNDKNKFIGQKTNIKINSILIKENLRKTVNNNDNIQ